MVGVCTLLTRNSSFHVDSNDHSRSNSWNQKLPLDGKRCVTLWCVKYHGVAGLPCHTVVHGKMCGAFVRGDLRFALIFDVRPIRNHQTTSRHTRIWFWVLMTVSAKSDGGWSSSMPTSSTTRRPTDEGQRHEESQCELVQ